MYLPNTIDRWSVELTYIWQSSSSFMNGDFYILLNFKWSNIIIIIPFKLFRVDEINIFHVLKELKIM